MWKYSKSPKKDRNVRWTEWEGRNSNYSLCSVLSLERDYSTWISISFCPFFCVELWTLLPPSLNACMSTVFISSLPFYYHLILWHRVVVLYMPSIHVRLSNVCLNWEYNESEWCYGLYNYCVRVKKYSTKRKRDKVQWFH